MIEIDALFDKLGYAEVNAPHVQIIDYASLRKNYLTSSRV